MPGTGDGAGQHRQRLGGEEGACQYCSQSGVLHPHLDGQGPLLRRTEAGGASGSPSQQVAERVVAEDDSEGTDKQLEAACQQVVVYRTDDTAHNARQADDTSARHQRLEDREGGTV